MLPHKCSYPQDGGARKEGEYECSCMGRTFEIHSAARQMLKVKVCPQFVAGLYRHLTSRTGEPVWVELNGCVFNRGGLAKKKKQAMLFSVH